MTDSLSSTSKSPTQKFIDGFVVMSSWKKKLLWLGTLLTLFGLTGHGASLFLNGSPQAATTQRAAVSIPGGGVGGGTGVNVAALDRNDINSAVEVAQERALAWWEWLAPHAWKAGLSFVIGFAIGMAARTFLKWLMIFAALGVVAFGSLKYLGLININLDASGAQTAYDSGMAWAKVNSDVAFDWVKTRLPSTVFSSVGMAIGFLRR